MITRPSPTTSKPCSTTLESSGEVAIAGFSMGGGEVARFVSKNPGRVSHAVLIGSVVPFLLKTDDHPEGAPKEVFDGMIEGIKKDRPAFFREFLKAFFGPGRSATRWSTMPGGRR